MYRFDPKNNTKSADCKSKQQEERNNHCTVRTPPHVRKGGMLNVSVPLDIQDMKHTQHPDSTNHLENFIGAWQGDHLERPPQVDYEIRKDFI